VLNLRKTIYFTAAVVTACALLFTVVALTRTTQESVPITRIIDTDSYGQIRVEVAKDIYRLGEPVQMRIFQKNIFDGPLQKGINLLGYGILDSSDRDIFSTCRYSLKIRQTLSTMEEFELPLGLTWKQVKYKGEQVPPGIYTVEVLIGPRPDIVEFQVAIVR